MTGAQLKSNQPPSTHTNPALNTPTTWQAEDSPLHRIGEPTLTPPPRRTRSGASAAVFFWSYRHTSVLRYTHPVHLPSNIFFFDLFSPNDPPPVTNSLGGTPALHLYPRAT